MEKMYKVLVLAALALGLTAGASESAPDAAETGAQTVLEQSKQRVRIRTYDRLLAKFRECEDARRQHLKPEAEAARLPPNERAVYDDQLARDRRRTAEAKAKLDAHKATMTDGDFVILAARDAAKKKVRKPR